MLLRAEYVDVIEFCQLFRGESLGRAKDHMTRVVNHNILQQTRGAVDSIASENRGSLGVLEPIGLRLYGISSSFSPQGDQTQSSRPQGFRPTGWDRPLRVRESTLRLVQSSSRVRVYVARPQIFRASD
jgi:hypothetical protein